MNDQTKDIYCIVYLEILRIYKTGVNILER